MKVLAGKTVRGPVSARMMIDGRPTRNFFGAGYLALSSLPEIRRAVAEALEQGVPFGQQLPAAHGAQDPIFDAIETLGSHACETEASVYFASGYMIGSIALQSVEAPSPVLLLDEHAHYSLRDAATLSGLPSHTFSHCDSQALEELLRREVMAQQRPLVLTDGVFATTGRIPPLAEYAQLLVPYEGRLVVDESHGFGVVGTRGRGAAEWCGVGSIAHIGTTLSKAYCANGAIVGCSRGVAERLRTLPPLGASCAGSPLSAVAAAASLKYVAAHPELRVSLSEMTGYLRAGLRGLGLEVSDSPAPIVTFRYGTAEDMRALQRRVFERGIYIHYSTYIGAGPQGMIRCAVFRDHSREDVDALVEALR